MGEVFEINQKQYFTIDEARGLLPVVRRVTEHAYRESELLTVQLTYLNNKEKRVEVEKRLKKCFTGWAEKIRKLGGETKGVWLVDFDSGEGYFCWKYPESELCHFHGYFDGYQNRVRID